MDNDRKLFEKSRAIASYVVQSNEPCDAMAEAVRALYDDDDISSTDMLKIFTGAIIYLAMVVDKAADSSMAALMGPLVLLYPDKSIEDIASMACALLTQGEPGPTKRPMFVVVRQFE